MRKRVTTIGDVAAKVAAQVEARIGVWKLLGAAAAHARANGVRLCLVEQGFVVSAGTKSELVPFVGHEADGGFLEAAINRVSPAEAKR